jgi:hypothetical protein
MKTLLITMVSLEALLVFLSPLPEYYQCTAADYWPDEAIGIDFVSTYGSLKLAPTNTKQDPQNSLTSAESC